MVLYKGKEIGEGERVVKREMKIRRDRGEADIGEEREGKRSERGKEKERKGEKGGKGKKGIFELLGHMLRSTEQNSIQCSFFV